MENKKSEKTDHGLGVELRARVLVVLHRYRLERNLLADERIHVHLRLIHNHKLIESWTVEINSQTD